MSTYIGRPASVIVVDDPHGYVAPSPGVQINTGRSQGKSTIMRIMSDGSEAGMALASRMINGMDPRRADFLDPIRKSMREQEPRIKQRSPKKRLKGLRP